MVSVRFAEKTVINLVLTMLIYRLGKTKFVGLFVIGAT